MSEETRDKNEEQGAARIDDLEPNKDAKGGGRKVSKPGSKGWSISGDADDRPTEEKNFSFGVE